MPSLEDPYDSYVAPKDLGQVGKPSGTCDNVNNSYSDSKQVKTCPDGKRIDHILYKLDPSWEVSIHRP